MFELALLLLLPYIKLAFGKPLVKLALLGKTASGLNGVVRIAYISSFLSALR